MAHHFRLYWRRETGCDAGTPVGLEDLDPVIRPRIAELWDELIGEGSSQEAEAPITIRLPFLDRREWRRRSESMRGVTLIREGSVIRNVPPNTGAALRDLAAETITEHPAWLAAPTERRPGYFRVWRNVSVALQEYLRRTVPEIYFRDAAAFEDRAAAWPLLVYQALRPFRGIPETEFTYDIAEPEMLNEALRLIRRPLQAILETTQQRLVESGRAELSRRYAPVWHEDVVRAVQVKPRRLLAVLGDEAALVDAVIALGASRDLGMVKPFARQVMATLRSFYDRDLRSLGAPLLAEATRALEAEMKLLSARQTSAGKSALRPISARPAVAIPAKRIEPTSSLPRAGKDRSFAAVNTFGHYRPGTGASR